MPSRLEIILKLTTIVYCAWKYSLNTTKAYGINIIEILKIEVNKKKWRRLDHKFLCAGYDCSEVRITLWAIWCSQIFIKMRFS